MTPAARVAAAIEILDMVGDGLPAEQVLTRWGRNNRFAGSKDRAAIRDYVFDVLRIQRTAAWLGRASTGRGLMIGLLRHEGVDPAGLFTGEGHAPAPLMDYELEAPSGDMPESEAWNLPDWLVALFQEGLGDEAAETAKRLQSRAPVILRVNTAKATLGDAIEMLAQAGVVVEQNPLSPNALTVLEGPRKIRNAPAYLEGYVELQDASSQAVVDALPEAKRALDYCAGGGGKSLALAARGDIRVFAHDIDPSRMRDLPLREARAGVEITQLGTGDLADQGPYDLVLVDAPCTGSGSWRRAPEAKWRLTSEQLAQTMAVQDSILDEACRLVSEGGTLAYATCSILPEENKARVDAFLARHEGWGCVWEKTFSVSENGDGFYTAHLTRQK
ncbi:RsmB/NOP family class I SAM-dependent RNA methyltransferase [Sulfitobacter donghicola]|uniref:SAM-dependent methlyltransferase n=1 Tax=Sulfitobacter donghicola DSW-25 = KCTC 12864 = JCM 14565 TaxID=1300350 RepID=A0A073IFZ3_9RHOB|nr:RsmB/NOP family class I SAM-dependent RNA methyltransferase [Sulfitobacter donghicola]KEJ88465.1 SAM-dependent methlyltransferase [Sulfitobacter donghicola DSW-25 = KCTC 12864 = JCM 14565]KIN69661.1 rRNA small subunit methyltransferase B [Sulfitobacter donghicola DSW-25 = KCTC 12864 = JCM 14565]